MREPQPKIQSHVIVLLGNFNPKIFQPAWFASHGLIKESEAEEAELRILHNDVVVFSLGWMDLEVTRERLVAKTSQEPYYEVIRDFVLGTFSLLRYTPITALGINLEYHFSVTDEEKWNNAGHRLAPKDVWLDVLERPGLLALAMQGQRSDGLKGFVRFDVQPSLAERPGLYFLVNNHFEIEKPESGNFADVTCQILADRWKLCMNESEEKVYTLLGRLL
jgi:hypothetical protein